MSVFSWATRDSIAAMPTVNVPFDVTIGPPRQPELHPATHQNIPGGGDVPLRCLAALPGARPFENTQRRLEHIMLRGDRSRSRMPQAYWLTLIVLALLLVPGAGLTGSSSSGSRSSHDSQSERPREPEVQTNDAKTKKSNPAPADNIAKLDEAETHVIGVYTSKNGIGKKKGRVEVRPTARPVVLVLTSYFSVDWHIKLADGARVKKTIVSGYFDQEVEGLPAEVPIVNRSYFPADGSRRAEGWFWAHQSNTSQWREVVRRLNDMTGLPVPSDGFPISRLFGQRRRIPSPR
jgi:hypothetical protein